MSSTITVGKRAVAFKEGNGRIVYLLFECMYESNIRPYDPCWSCHYLGPVEGALRRIFLWASHCEGGMLQGRHGWITPEGYLERWLRELAAPVPMGEEMLCLEAGGSWDASVPAGELARTCAALEAAGREDLAGALARGERATLLLREDAAAVLSLCGPEGFLSPWRLIYPSMLPPDSPRAPELGYRPPPAADHAAAVPEALKVDAENRLLRRADGTWYCAGWKHTVIGNFVASFWEEELLLPGSYKRRIRAYRDGVKNAPPIPEGVRVVVDLAGIEEDGEREQAREFRERFPVRPLPGGFEVEPTEENLYELTHLRCGVWVVPATQAMGEEVPEGQLSLFGEEQGGTGEALKEEGK